MLELICRELLYEGSRVKPNCAKCVVGSNFILGSPKKNSSYGIAGEINKYLVTFLKLEFLNQDVLLMGAFAKQEISAVFVLTFLLLNSFAPKDWVRVAAN